MSEFQTREYEVYDRDGVKALGVIKLPLENGVPPSIIQLPNGEFAQRYVSRYVIETGYYCSNADWTPHY